MVAISSHSCLRSGSGIRAAISSHSCAFRRPSSLLMQPTTTADRRLKARTRRWSRRRIAPRSARDPIGPRGPRSMNACRRCCCRRRARGRWCSFRRFRKSWWSRERRRRSKFGCARWSASTRRCRPRCRLIRWSGAYISGIFDRRSIRSVGRLLTWMELKSRRDVGLGNKQIRRRQWVAVFCSG